MSDISHTLPTSEAAQHSDQLRLAKRKKLFTLLGGVVALGALAAGGYWVLVASHHVSTDNAYVAAEIAQVTPEVTGTVREVLAVDTQAVKRGDILARLDDSDAKLNLSQAEAELARAERRVQGYLALRQNELDKARSSYQRLLDRLPDDREGGLNLALIDWRSGDKDAARKRLSALRSEEHTSELSHAL